MTNPRGNDNGIKGRKIPNLVVEYDSGKGYEFRVQCEVGLDDQKSAEMVKEDVALNTPDSLKRAKKAVLAAVDRGATKTFRRIIEEAFNDNIAQIEPAGRR